MAVIVKVKRLPHNADLPLPQRMSERSSGLDLLAAVSEPVAVAPGETVLIPTGLALSIPPGYEGQVRPRSGLAANHGLTILNAPGTIDADYRGELKVLLINLGKKDVNLTRGDRIAQLVIAPVTCVSLQETSDLDETARGGGGFGHTGV
ncbi:MAG: dUTP diphosphatase [Candidatus Abyssobacteria bacterium SURF_17]|jgi:dUTP pyrophosphatase|uniref:Deoxyuridine 5'-triphosphate nucleotidohydrolase n=1 Tax=Candidatus Abyssobacteria bacterium SURF_17 TaxID=2093361 RepID=A0A419ETV3_9BACT|nr:MAG: dUTP diphosphatase [Candidatus Abyssubacteria bacterium SURF_17]